MSAANSLQFNQLIGGAISPSVISSAHQNGGGAATSAKFTSAGHTTAPAAAAAAALSPNSHNQNQSPHLMIGDYVQGNMGNVLPNSYRQQ